MGNRFATRTWHAAPTAAAPPVEQVQDPAVRAILRIVSRSLKAICAEIDRRCGSPGP